jgi:hypothetical protein
MNGPLYSTRQARLYICYNELRLTHIFFLEDNCLIEYYYNT